MSQEGDGPRREPVDGPPPADRPAAPEDEAAAGREAPRPGEDAGAAEGAGEEVRRLAAERDEYLESLQRLKAEFENYRKRHERERQTMALGAAREVVRDLLPVMDNLERAVEALGEHGESIAAGVEMVRGQLAGLLEGRGVQEIEALGREFDPTVHEAIAQIPTATHAEGTVVEVVEKGYLHSEAVLRPSRVVVAGPPAESPGEGGGGDDDRS